jgi:citrate synthase
MHMLKDIGDADKVEEWVRSRIESNQRVMGLGHAVYKTEDPRARILRNVAEEALQGTRDQQWFDLSLKVDEVARRLLKEMKTLELYPNVDFYSGGVLSALGLPDAFFPAFFAVSRVSGWCAHYIEEEFAEAQPKATIYRPRANYTGRLCGPQGCQFIPLEQRGAGCMCGNPLNTCEEELAVKEL